MTRWSLGVFLGPVAACAGVVEHRAYTPAELRAEVRRAAPEVEEPMVPFAVSEGQAATALLLVSKASTPEMRARVLLDAIMGPSRIALSYANHATTTAEEALRRGEGNCVALASAVVGLARAVGLVAFYVDLSMDQQEVAQHQGLVVRTGHIGAVIRTDQGYGGIEIGQRWVTTGHWRPMSDLEATAHFYNNRGFDLLHEMDEHEEAWRRAREHFSIAVRLHPGFGAAWNNLGLAHARLGDDAGARVHYARAANLPPPSAAPWSNLGASYLRAGEAQLDPRSPSIAAMLQRARDRVARE